MDFTTCTDEFEFVLSYRFNSIRCLLFLFHWLIPWPAGMFSQNINRPDLCTVQANVKG